MAKRIFLSITLLAMILISCNNKEAKKDNQQETSEHKVKAATIEIPYTVAHNYFAKTDSLPNNKIEDEKTFSEYFGMATTMGENGRPTTINFEKDYVIAVVIPSSDSAVELVPMDLKKSDEGDIVFTYIESHGQRLSYITRPCVIIIVSRKYDGAVKLNPEIMDKEE